MIAKSGAGSRSTSSKYAWTHTKGVESTVTTSVSGSGCGAHKSGGEVLGKTPSADSDWLDWRGGFNDDLAKQVYAGLGLGNISPPLSPNSGPAPAPPASEGCPATAVDHPEAVEGPQSGASLDEAIKRERLAQKSFSSQLLEKRR